MKRAALIGVSTYIHYPAAPLPAVIADLNALEAALTDEGYRVDVLGKDPRAPTFASVCNFLHDACTLARDGDTLLIYFSGHGVHHNGRDFLVPTDARLTSARLIPRNAVAVDLDGEFLACAASQKVFLIDACRENMAANTKSLGEGWSTMPVEAPGDRHGVFVYGCKQGEFSYVLNGNAGSAMARGLIDALHAETFNGSVSDWVRKAQRVIDGLHDTRMISGVQTIHSRYDVPVNAPDPLETLFIFDRNRKDGGPGSGSGPQSQPGLSPPPPPPPPPVRFNVAEFNNFCVRVMARLTDLLRQRGCSAQFFPAEHDRAYATEEGYWIFDFWAPHGPINATLSDDRNDYFFCVEFDPPRRRGKSFSTGIAKAHCALSKLPMRAALGKNRNPAVAQKELCKQFNKWKSSGMDEPASVDYGVVWYELGLVEVVAFDFAAADRIAQYFATAIPEVEHFIVTFLESRRTKTERSPQ